MRHRSWLLAAATLLFAACVPQPAPYTGGDVAELQRVDQTVGSGDEAVPGKNVTVHYSGWLYEQTAADKHGKPFDSSHNRAEPFTFPLGAGQVIKGWDEGVAGMRVGGKRTLLIPAEYGYGARGAGRAIPPGASLVFDVELLKVE